MVVLLLLSIMLAIFYAMADTMQSMTNSQEALIVTRDEGRQAVRAMVRDLRNASTGSINWGGMPLETLSYRVATDLDGNGLAVDVDGNLELSGVRTIGPDVDDINGDTLTTTQLIWSDGATTRVLTSSLAPVNGIQFDQVGPGLRISVTTQHQASVHGPMLQATLNEIIVPRN